MFDLMFHSTAGYIFITIVGLLVGSFLNVVISRVPIMIEREEKAWAKAIINNSEEEALPMFNLLAPASHCPHCKYKMRWYENIPLIAWIFLRGKCSACGGKISVRYPIVEAVTAVASLLVAIKFYAPSEAIFALLFTWGLIALIFIDEAHQILPDRITLPLMWLGIIAALLQPQFIDLSTSISGVIIGYLSLWIIYWIFKLITKKEGMGYGDFKLLACLCAWQSFIFIPYIILIAAVIGLIYAFVIALPKGKAIPFGPALAFSGWICFMYGPYIASYTGNQPV